MAQLIQPVPCELLDVTDVRLLGPAVEVGVLPQVLVALIVLRVLLPPGATSSSSTHTASLS